MKITSTPSDDESFTFNNCYILIRNQYEAKLKELQEMPITWADKSEIIPQEEFQKLGKQ